MDTDVVEPVDEDLEDLPEDMVFTEDDLPDGPTPFWAVLAPEGVTSGDRRQFLDGSLSTRDLPLPIRWQRIDDEGHRGAEVVASVAETFKIGNLLVGAGTFTDSETSDEVIGLIAEQHLRGVSVDVDDFEFALEDEDSVSFSRARVSAATIVPIPAFQEARIHLGPLTDDVLASFGADVEAFKRGAGWVTHPKETSRLHRYWTKGPGAAKVRWGTPGDFTRLRRYLAKYISPPYLNRTAAQWHYDALGYWPGELGKPGNPPDTKENRRRAARHAATDGVQTFAAVTLATPKTEVLPAEAFTDPGLEGPTALTITPEGRIYGHLALWGTCHIGMEGACVTPPESATGYAYFRTGAVLTEQGEVPVGQITMGTGHADLSLDAMSAVAHYDNTGLAVADIAAGEDTFGIWVAGMLRADVTEQQVRALRAAALSGDWRRVGRNLEMIAALAVNVPGFPVPRVALAASAGRQTALVAAGVVGPDTMAWREFSTEDLAKQVVDEMERRAARRQVTSIKVGEMRGTINAIKVRRLKDGLRLR